MPLPESVAMITTFSPLLLGANDSPRNHVMAKITVSMASILFLVCFTALAVAAQSRSSTAPRPTDKKRISGAEAELIQVERDIGEANIKRDKAFFERVEADEFIFTDSAGGITTKAEDVASLDRPPGEFRLVSYIVDEVKVFDYGKTAVVTGRTTTVSRSKDREVTNKSRFTDVFVKRDGRWQLAAGHSSRIREPQK